MPYVKNVHPCTFLTATFLWNKKWRCTDRMSVVLCSIEFFSRKNSKQPNVHGCTFGCDGIRAASELTSLSMLGREFACRKLTALTGCQWFTEESSLQCKLEVQECAGRTSLNDVILGGSECVPPCTFLTASFLWNKK